jgi:peptidoglycan/xylan/chitin deacetylase (PgdA/CDA1 family)
MDRRTLLTLLAVGTAGALTGCTPAGQQALSSGAGVGPIPQPAPVPGVVPRAAPSPSAEPSEDPPSATPDETESEAVVEPFDPPPTIGPPVLIDHLPLTSRLQNQIAITIDDGYDRETVAAYVEFAQATGIHLTFNPNGVYGGVWEPHAEALRPLIEAGQVQIGNHTFSHKDVKRLSDHALEEEMESNEDWVFQTFGTSTRPWFRPPFGFRNARTDELAASLGWTNILLWNGSFGDSGLIKPTVLLQQARTYLRPGTIMLGHANKPTVTHLYDRIVEILNQRGLTAKTLNEAFSGLLPPAGPGSPGRPTSP